MCTQRFRCARSLADAMLRPNMAFLLSYTLPVLRSPAKADFKRRCIRHQSVKACINSHCRPSMAFYRNFFQIKAFESVLRSIPELRLRYRMPDESDKQNRRHLEVRTLTFTLLSLLCAYDWQGIRYPQHSRGGLCQLKCSTHSGFNQTDEYETTECFSREDLSHPLPLIHNAPSVII